MKKIFLFVLIVCMAMSLFAETGAYKDYLSEIHVILTEHNLYEDDMAAQDFNLAGMFFYDRNLWYEAEIMFLRATELKFDHVLANYNLACVLSIQFNDKNARHPLILDSHQSVPFFYLYQSTVSDHNRMNRARIDSDLNNIREFDPILFDSITLPVEQRQKYENEVYFESANSFEGDTQLVFVDDVGEQFWLSVENKVLKEHDFYHMSEDSMIPYAITNEEQVGKKFKIVTVYSPGDSGLAGGSLLFKERILLSIEAISN